MALETDFIVIGSGIAGLRAGIELAKSGAQVTVLTKDKTSESNTEYAQGGVAVVLSDDDNAELHEEDTLIAGAGLCDEEAVETLVTDGTLFIRPRRRKSGFHAGSRAFAPQDRARARRFDRKGNRSRSDRPGAPGKINSADAVRQHGKLDHRWRQMRGRSFSRSHPAGSARDPG
jgi:glycine/D-amino acid oxidase-like deaminating enzyme